MIQETRRILVIFYDSAYYFQKFLLLQDDPERETAFQPETRLQ